jgi:N-ethylmaleimide reductase
MTTLFSPLKFGALTVPNRIFMAPLTRCRADAEHVPTALMSEYYAQRATAGLIIAEATMAMENNSAFWREPGIHSPAQVALAGSGPPMQCTPPAAESSCRSGTAAARAIRC